MNGNSFLTVTAAVLCSLSVLASEKGHSLEYQIDAKLPARERVALIDFLEKAHRLLPQKIKTAVGKVDVKLETSDFINKQNIIARVGRGGSIIINQNYIKEIVAGPEGATKTPERQHKNKYNESLAAVLHETVHIYDNLNLHTPAEKELIRKCRTPISLGGKASDTIDRKKKEQQPAVCRYYNNVTQTFSQNPYFLQTAGWVGLDFNGFKQRSPDIYELTNNKEYLAVNMEYFLLDPEYKCRRPSMYRLLSRQFEHIPFADITCDRTLGYVMPGTKGDLATLRSIDPRRVYQVHYLLADKGEAMMSGWGHSMIRLVVCSPERQSVGPECLQDISDHVVLSYRAFVDSLNISTLDGLTGKYPSRLFIIPLNQAIDEYNKTELRALKSVPLNLTRSEIDSFLVRSVEAHWAYDGNYYFISNNCATETFNLLKGSLLRQDLILEDIRTPLDIIPALVRLKLADTSKIQDLKKALVEGYYFDSYEGRYQRSFEIIKESFAVNAKDFREFLALSPAIRAQYISKISFDDPKYRQKAAAFLNLESAALRKMDAKIMGEIQKQAIEEMKRLQDEASKVQKSQKNSSSSTNKLSQLAEGYLKLSTMFAMPSSFIAGEKAYGLPSPAERTNAAKRILVDGEQAKSIEGEAVKIVESFISKEDMDQALLCKANLTRLLEIIRKDRKPLVFGQQAK